MNTEMDFSDVTPEQAVTAAGLALITLFFTYLSFWGAKRVEVGSGNNLRANGLLILALGSYVTAATLGLVPPFETPRAAPVPHTPA